MIIIGILHTVILTGEEASRVTYMGILHGHHLTSMCSRASHKSKCVCFFSSSNVDMYAYSLRDGCTVGLL